MTGNGARMTPIRGPETTRSNPKKPVLQPRSVTVSPVVAAGFVALMIAAVGYGAYMQFAGSDLEEPSIVAPQPGARVTGVSHRMTTGLDIGEGQMTTTLTDDVPAPVAGPDTGVLQARIVELETALEEAGKESPEVAALTEQHATARGRIEELETTIQGMERDKDRAADTAEERLKDELAALVSGHGDTISQLMTEHEATLAVVEGRLAQLLDERAAASARARVMSQSVLVNRGAPKVEAAFGAPVMPGDPATSLGRGATFLASLLNDVDAVTAGSISAMVVSDVRSAGGGAVLIPRGSTLRGRYRSDTSEADGRIVISWNEVVLQPEGRTRDLSSGPRDENAFVTTLWPSDPASMNRDAVITILVANEIVLTN